MLIWFLLQWIKCCHDLGLKLAVRFSKKVLSASLFNITYIHFAFTSFMLWKLSGNLSNKLIDTDWLQEDCIYYKEKKRVMAVLHHTHNMCLIISYTWHNIYLFNKSVCFFSGWGIKTLSSSLGATHLVSDNLWVPSYDTKVGYKSPYPTIPNQQKSSSPTPNIYPSKWSHYLPVNWFKVSDKLTTNKL